jgi:hypothetical protein
MDGLEERVRRALGAGALAADPSLVDVDAVHAGIATRRRRRLALVSTIGVMAVLGAGGGVLLSQQDHKPKSTSVLSDPTPSAEASTVPSTFPAQCTSAQLRLVSAITEGAAGHSYTEVAVRNAGSALCKLGDSPGLAFQGSARPDAVRHDGSIPGDASRVSAVAAGATVKVTLDAQKGCPGSVQTYSRIELVLDDGSTISVPSQVESTCPLLVTNWYDLP